MKSRQSDVSTLRSSLISDPAVQGRVPKDCAGPDSHLELDSRRVLFLPSLLLFLIVLWCGFSVAWDDGPPRILPSFEGGPGYSGFVGLFELPQTLGTFLVWLLRFSTCTIVAAVGMTFAYHMATPVAIRLLISLKLVRTKTVQRVCIWSIAMGVIAILLSIVRPFAS